MNGLEELIRSGFSMVEKNESLEFHNVKITVVDQNTAILINEYKQSMLLTSGDFIQLAGGGSQVWSKSSGEWKLVSISASDKPSEQ